MNLEQSVTVAQDRLATGATYRELAATYGTSPTSIYRALSKPEIQDILETGMQQQISLIPKAIDTVKSLLDSDDETIKLNASKVIMMNTGMSPSHAPSIILQKITNNTNITVLSDRLERVLQLADGQAAPPDDAQEIIDI